MNSTRIPWSARRPLLLLMVSVRIVVFVLPPKTTCAQPGTPLWTNRYDGPAHNHDYARALAVDSQGNVIVTGYSYNGSANDYARIKYSNAGVPIWTNRYNGPGNSYDLARAVAVDRYGIVYVTGSSLGNSSYDYATVAYLSSGLPF